MRRADKCFRRSRITPAKQLEGIFVSVLRLLRPFRFQEPPASVLDFVRDNAALFILDPYVNHFSFFGNRKQTVWCSS